MTIFSKHLGGHGPLAPPGYAYALHDTRTVNPGLVQCECHTGK